MTRSGGSKPTGEICTRRLLDSTIFVNVIAVINVIYVINVNNNKCIFVTGKVMMNQFAQLLSAEKQTTILLDCCTIIGAHNGKPGVLKFRKRIASRKDLRIIVPSILVREVAKIAKITREEALALIESFSDMGQIDYVGDDVERNREAELLNVRYPGYCHYPDNRYLLACKEYDATLLTYDRKLKDVALGERVAAYSPEEFGLYHQGELE
jgi:hypothetical protein